MSSCYDGPVRARLRFLAPPLLLALAACSQPARLPGHLTIEPVGGVAAGLPAATAVATPTPVPLPTPAGEPVQPGFFKAVEPPYVAGTTWRRRITGEGNALIDITEVLAADGTTAHLRQYETRDDGVTAVPAREFDVPQDGNPLLAALPSALRAGDVPLLLGFQGYEDVTVPAGTFTHCAKLGFSGLDVDTIFTGTAWLAEGAGVVKLVASTVAQPPVVTTQELIEVKRI
jgi:hypothetical protein